MKTKILITLGFAGIALVITTLAIYFATIQNVNLTIIATFSIIGLIILFALYVLWDKTRNVTKGLPAADERTKINSYKAGYYGFIAAIWSAVFTPVVVDIIFNYEMEGSQVSGAVVVIAGLVFFISYLWISRKGTN
jgi:low temperature requirement protein LtrA